MSSLRTILGVLLAGLLLLTGCSALGGTNDGGYITGDGRTVYYDPEDRGDPVDLKGQSLEGEPVDVTAMRGSVVVVNIWWSQCGPCISEMPMLQQAHEELGADQVEFVGINTRDNSPETGLDFERAAGVTYPSIFARDGQALLAFDTPPTTTPATVVLDREGRVAAQVNGAIPSKTTLTDVVGDVLSDARYGDRDG